MRWGVPFCWEESPSSEAALTSVETDVWNKSSVLSAASAPCALGPPPVGNVPPDRSNEVSKPENKGRVRFCRHDKAIDHFPVVCLHRWLFAGISRYKAIELLMLPNNRNGAFLIRESETNTGLSVQTANASELTASGS